MSDLRVTEAAMLRQINELSAVAINLRYLHRFPPLPLVRKERNVDKMNLFWGHTGCDASVHWTVSMVYRFLWPSSMTCPSPQSL